MKKITKKMMMILISALICVPFASLANGAELVKTLTFAWDQNQTDLQYLKNWEMHWSVSAGGPYVKLTDILYNQTGGTSFESPIDATVTGSPGTSEVRYFVLKACGDIPIEGGGTELQCSGWSNEVSYSFWIPVGAFQVPVQFRILIQ